MKKILFVYSVAFFLVCLCRADVLNLDSASGLTGTATETRNVGTAIDAGVVYLKATLEVTSSGAFDTTESFGGIGVSFWTDPFEFGQPWEQTSWGTGGTTTPPEPYNMPLFPNSVGVSIALNTPVTVVLKYDYNSIGADGGVYYGVYFNPDLLDSELNNSGVFTSDGRTMTDSLSTVYYRVGASTDNSWNFTDVAVYSAGDTPFAVPEPASVLLLGFVTTACTFIRRRFMS